MYCHTADRRAISGEVVSYLNNRETPIVLVHKKDGTIHFCMGYHKLNAVTQEDAYSQSG